MGLTEQTQDNKAIIASDSIVRKTVVVTGGTYTAGTILGRITDNRNMTEYDSGSENGAEHAKCVLLEDVDATDSDVVTEAGFAGVYVKANMIGLDQSAEDELEGRGIYFV